MNVLTVEAVSKYFGGLCAVDKVSFSVSPGEIVGLIGPNGSGKTTIFNVITGNLPPDEGRIIFKGENITGLRPHSTCRKGIGRTFQTTKPFRSLTIMDNTLIACYPKSRSKREALKKAEELISIVGLDEKRDDLAKSLTLAQTKLLEIARALAGDPDLLLLDEVMAGLNEKEINDAIALINRIRDNQIGIIVIEHIFKVIMSITDNVIVLDQGKKIAEGPSSTVINDENVLKAYFGEDYAFA